MSALSRPLIGESSALKRVHKAIHAVAPTISSALVLGESGTGKELVARAIHELSPRRSRAFVPVNCGAIPENLLESELFGHSKGAFTGAHQNRQGRFTVAQGGSLFLDEIGEMSPLLQVKLLRVLQERRFEPLGCDRSQEADVRIIAATNKDLEAEVEAKRFREDLYYRLAVVEIPIPPLRERGDDILLLLKHFNQNLKQERGRSVLGFSPATQTRLLNYHWPGNVRELENLVERLSIFCMDEVVEEEELPPKLFRGQGVRGLNNFELPDDGLDLKAMLFELEEQLILQALKRTSWNKNQAARLLKMNRTTLVEKLKKRGMLNPKP